MMRRMQWMIGLGVLLTCSLALSEPALAAATLVQPCSEYVGVANRVVSCIRDTMDGTAAAFFSPSTGFYPMVAGAIRAFIFLVIVLYGVLVTGGMLQKPSADSFMLLIKVGLVGWFTTNTPLMYSSSLTMMDSATLSMIRLIPSSGSAGYNQDYINVNCLNSMRIANETAGKGVTGPWASIDCLLDTVIGIKPKDTEIDALEKNEGKQNLWVNANTDQNLSGLKRGMLYFFFSSMFSSVLGVIFGIMGLLMVWGLISLVLRTLFTYLAGVIGLSFMMIISPLFIPLLLLRSTTSYFKKWADVTLSFAMQPILAMFFLSISICLIDLAIFSGDYSLMYKIAGNASREPGFNLNTYLSENMTLERETVTLTALKGDTTIATPTDTATEATQPEGVFGKVRSSVCTAKMIEKYKDKLSFCGDVVPITADRNALNWQKLAEARVPAVTSLGDGAKTKGEQLAREVLASTIFCILLMFLMNAVARVIPEIFTNLVGDAKQTPNLQVAAMAGIDKATTQFKEETSANLGNSIKGKLG